MASSSNTNWILWLIVIWAAGSIIITAIDSSFQDNGHDTEIHRLSAEVRQLKLDRAETFRAVEQLDEKITEFGTQSWIDCNGRDEP